MAIVETLTIVENAGADANPFAYSPLGVPSPVTVRPNVPELWYVHKCYEQITTGSPTNTVAIVGTTITINGTGITMTIPPRVGDIVSWSTGAAARVGIITTINITVAGTINWVLSPLPGQTPAGAGSNLELWISYQNRRGRLGTVTMTASTGDVFYPVPFGQPHIANIGDADLIEDGNTSTVYYLDASRFAQSLYTGLPMANARTFVQSILFSWSLLASSDVTTTYSIVRNQTVYSELMQSYRIGSTTYDVRFEVGNVTVKAGLPTFNVEAASVILGTASGPVVCFPSHADTKWVMFQSRYGTPMVLPFNYALDETLETNLLGTARRGYDTRNVNMQGFDSLELSTGMVSNRFAEWHEDLATSPYVYVADPLPFGLIVNPDGSAPAPTGPVVLYNSNQWQEYRIEAGSITTRANANDLMALSFTVVKVRQRITYNA
jgi:hypothetical protein